MNGLHNSQAIGLLELAQTREDILNRLSTYHVINYNRQGLQDRIFLMSAYLTLTNLRCLNAFLVASCLPSSLSEYNPPQFWNDDTLLEWAEEFSPNIPVEQVIFSEEYDDYLIRNFGINGHINIRGVAVNRRVSNIIGTIDDIRKEVLEELIDELPIWYFDGDGDGYHSETRQAKESPGTNWKTATKGLDCDDNDILLMLNCNFKITATENTLNIDTERHVFSKTTPAELKIKVKFKLENETDTSILNNLISNMVIEMDLVDTAPTYSSITRNGTTFEVEIKVNGMPTKNSHFGEKEIRLKYKGVLKNQKEIKVFFEKDETNNPSTTGTVPNWYYYWIEDVQNSPVKAQVTGKNCTYAGSGSGGQFAEYDGNFISPTYSIYDGAVGNEVYSVPFSVNRKGIDVLAATLVHEETHRIVDQNQANGIWPAQGSAGDLDGDELPNTLEDIRIAFGYNKNMRFSTAFIGFPYGDDEEVYCEQIANGSSGDSTLDWSKNGKQW